MSKRISSKVKQKQIETKFLEQQTKKMQEKLNDLKKQVQQQKRMKSQQGMDSTISRWRKASNSNANTNAPLKDYGKQIIEQQKQAYKKFGINTSKITGTKSFNPVLTKIKLQKEEQQQRNMTRIPKLMSSNYSNTNNQTNNNFLKQTQSVDIFLPTQSIQNNFFKAKIQVKKLIHQKSLLQFLEQNFVQQYFKTFQENQIKSLDDLRFISKQKLQQLGVKAGHQVKILKRIKQQFNQNKDNVPSTSKKQKSSQLNLNEQSQRKAVSFGYGDGNIEEYEKLNQQDQIIKRQHINTHTNEFIQSYNENNLKLQKQDLSGEEDQYQLQQNQEQNQQEQEYYDQVQFITVPMSQINLQIDQSQSQQFSSFLCFGCYKKSLQSSVFKSFDDRKFCSQKCLQKYLQSTQKKCPQCGINFFKGDGFYQNGLWFCSIGCCPNRNQIQEMFIQWKKKQINQN